MAFQRPSSATPPLTASTARASAHPGTGRLAGIETKLTGPRPWCPQAGPQTGSAGEKMTHPAGP